MAFAKAEEIVGKVYNIKTLGAAENYLAKVLNAALANTMGNKHDRPWQIVDFKKKLDNEQPWIGFEFETGFDDKEEYQQFIHWLWKQDYVAIDREGSGNYPVECAFPPQTLADVEQNGHLLQRAVEFINEKQLTAAGNCTTFTKRDIGIHAGISSAKFRAMGVYAKSAVIERMAAVLNSLNHDERMELYGRTALHWGTASNRSTYVELKMFKSTTNVEQIKGYIKVVKKCIEMMDLFIDDPKAKIDDAYSFLSGGKKAKTKRVAAKKRAVKKPAVVADALLDF